MISLEDVKRYLRIDFDDEDVDLQIMIDTAVTYIDSMVGTNYKSNEKLQNMADLLTKKLVSDLYENRSYTITNNSKRDYICTSILDKLSLATEGDNNGS